MYTIKRQNCVITTIVKQYAVPPSLSGLWYGSLDANKRCSRQLSRILHMHIYIHMRVCYKYVCTRIWISEQKTPTNIHTYIYINNYSLLWNCHQVPMLSSYQSNRKQVLQNAAVVASKQRSSRIPPGCTLYIVLTPTCRHYIVDMLYTI